MEGPDPGIAALPNVVCNFGLTTEADTRPGRASSSAPISTTSSTASASIASFTAATGRCPSSPARYAAWLDALDWATADFSPEDKRKLFRDNAIKAYRLNA